MNEEAINLKDIAEIKTKSRRFNWPRIFGYDFFISFKLGPPPIGAQSYASDLARRLRELDFTVFFSEEEAPPGAKLDTTLVKALYSSRILVVIANEGALVQSQWVRKEVEEFRRKHPMRPVIPINVGDAIAKHGPSVEISRWLDPDGSIWLDETNQAVEEGITSQELIKRLEVAPRFMKANTRLRWALGIIILGLVTLTTVAVWQYFEAKFEALQAKSRQLAAQSVSEMDENPELGLLLGVQGHNVASTIETSDALLSALDRVRGVRAFLPGVYIPGTLAFSTDGALMAVGRCETEYHLRCESSVAIDIWRVAGPQQIGTVRVVTEVESLAFSFDAHRLAATLRCDNMGDKEQTHALMFALAGDPYATGEVKLVKVSDELFECGREPSPAEQLADARDVAATNDALERVRRAAGASAEAFSGWPATFGPDSRVIATVTGAYVGAPIHVELWDTTSRTRRLARAELRWPMVEEGATMVGGKDIRADGKLAAAFGCQNIYTGRVCGAGELAIIDATGEEPRVATIGYDLYDWIRSLALVPGEPLVLSGGCGKKNDGNCDYGELRIWRVEDEVNDPISYEPVRTFGGAVESIAVTTDGKTMGLTSQRGRVSLWRLDGQRRGEKGWLASPLEAKFSTAGTDTRPALKCGGEVIESVVLRTVGAQLQAPEELCAALEGLALGPALDGKQGVVAELSDPGTRLALSGCAVRQNGECEGPRTTVWLLVERHLAKLATVETTGEVTSLAFATDGNRLAIASCSDLTLVQYCETGKIELIELAQDDKPKRTLAESLRGVTAIAFRPGGEELAFATCAQLAYGSAVRDCTLGAIHFLGLTTLSGIDVTLYGHLGEITDLAFNPDGTLLVSGSSDGSVALWDSAHREQLGPVLPAHPLPVESVRFVSAERFISSTDSEEIEWDTTVTSWKRAACQIANRNLTHEEWRKYMGDETYRMTCPNLSDPDDAPQLADSQPTPRAGKVPSAEPATTPTEAPKPEASPSPLPQPATPETAP